MDGLPPERNDTNFNQIPGDRKTNWNWRATGLFYPETDDWALNLPPDARTDGAQPGGAALRESASASPGQPSL